MKRTKRNVAAGAAALLAVAGAGGAIAATQISPEQERQAFLDDAAEELGVSADELASALRSALENRVDDAVEAGRLTEEQGEALKERIRSGDFPLFGFGHGPGMFEHHVDFPGFEAAASYLGVSEDQLRTELEDGNTLADVAREHGKSVDGLVDVLVAGAKKHLDEAVADGRLTREHADEMLSHLEEGIRAMVNGEVREGHRGPGFRFRSGGAPLHFDGAA
jgi:polyhydroxyalkanoate synthesis regulator phasin